jgi:hypothetical protein
MADLCVECERLWSEYTAAMHNYLGLTRELPLTVLFLDQPLGPVMRSKREFQSKVTELRQRISQHEFAEHSQAN